MASVRLRDATIYGLRIPFVESFTHGTKSRRASDALVVRLTTDEGVSGYGEGIARPYVTGESVDSVVDRIRGVIWPAIRDVELTDDDGLDSLTVISELLPSSDPDAKDEASGIIYHGAARCAVELALLDLLTRMHGKSVTTCMPPRTQKLRYSGVIGMVSPRAAAEQATKMNAVGLDEFKVKVGDDAGLDRLVAIRNVVGDDASIRVDANGVWSFGQAVDQIAKMAAFDIDMCEEPLGRQGVNVLPDLAGCVPVPLLLDESLVTEADARALVEMDSQQLRFNLRVSKCGGLGPCLALAAIARGHGLGFVIGCQVGETSLLSAAGRHLAAFLDDHLHLEGSFGTFLLSEDIATPEVQFGPGGLGSLLNGPGLGVSIVEERLESLATFQETLR